MDNVFNILKEIDSILKKNEDLQSKSLKQNKRTKNIASQIDDRKELLASLEVQNKLAVTNQTELENTLNSSQTRLESKKNQLNEVVTQNQLDTINNEIKNLENSCEILEEKVLLSMEEIESRVDEIKDAKQFISGATKTLQDIQEESKDEFQELQKKSQINRDHIEEIKKELPEDFLRITEVLMKKNLSFSFLTRIKQGHCELCGHQSRAEDKSRVAKLQLAQCSNCSRVFIQHVS